MLFVLFVLFFPIINAYAYCSENVSYLEPIIDITIHDQQPDIPTTHVNSIKISTTLIELNYFILTKNYYNISEECIQSDLDSLNDYNNYNDCKDDIVCTLEHMKSINLVPTDYYGMKISMNHLLPGLSYSSPIGIENVKIKTTITLDELAKLLEYGGIISYVDQTILNENGYNDDIKLSSTINKPILIVGLFQDFYNDVYVKYNSFSGYSWGCDGYGYIRITEFAMYDSKIMNNCGILSTNVIVTVKDKYKQNELYVINKSTVKNVTTFIIVNIVMYCTFVLIVAVISIMYVKKSCRKQTHIELFDNDNDL